MSKTIIIPKYNDPFTVVINNEVYQYKGGETVEVPDDVAEAIADALELVPTPKRYLSKLAQSVDGSITEISAKDIEGITTIVTYAFYNRFNIRNVTIPKSVVSIADRAFCGCVALEKVVFEDGDLNGIGENTFDWCGKLTRVYLPTTPPTLANVNAFLNISTTCTFYCKSQASLDAYKAAENWSTLTGTYSFVVEE